MGGAVSDAIHCNQPIIVRGGASRTTCRTINMRLYTIV